MAVRRELLLALLLLKTSFQIFAQIEEEKRKEYDNSFEQFSTIAKEIIKEGKYDNVSRLIDFRRLVLWVRLEGNTYYSLQEGRNYGVYISIVPIENEITKRLQSSFQTECNGLISVILIQPVEITTKWQSLFLIHELSHLKDNYLNRNNPESDRKEYLINEMNAYLVEIDAANILSNNGFEDFLKKQIVKWSPSNIDDIFQKFNEMDDNEIMMLRNSITSEPSKSIEESMLRAGFYLIAFCIESMKMGITSEENICELINSTY